MTRIDLNADLGESFGVYTLGHDAELMPLVTSANIACGFHAGDPSVMRRTLKLAREAGVAVGAHPAFPDLAGFGRRAVRMTGDELEDLVAYQIGALAALATAEGLRLQHVKPHGALYNMAGADSKLAASIARAVAAVDRALLLFGLPESALLDEGRKAGLRVVPEGFADRAYERDGRLVPREEPDAVFHDPDEVAARAVRMATEGTVTARDGSVITLAVETICLHGDTPGAAGLAARVRRGLERAGVSVRPVGQP